MNNEIMVSVSCLVYNHEKYLRKCLDGFVMQKTNFKFEVLVHDDASTDGSANIIREYEAKYPDIIKPIYQTENQHSKRLHGGITGNFQMPRAKGKYYAECEGDDYWCDEYKLQKQFDALENNPDCKLCVHRVAIFDSNTNEDMGCCPQEEQKTGVIDSNVFTNQILERYSYQTSSYFCDKQMYIEKNDEEFVMLSPTGDEAVVMYFGCKANVYYINDIMSKYRKFSEGSWSSSYRNNNQQRINIQKRRVESLKAFNDFSDYKYNKTCKRVIRRNEYEIAALSNDYRGMIKYPEFLKKDNKKTIFLAIIGSLFPKTTRKIRGE